MIREKELSKYRKSVEAALEGAPAYRKLVSESLEQDIHIYLEENPNASVQELRLFFGEPEAFAREYTDTYRYAVEKAKRNQTKLFTIVTAGVLAALLMWAFGIGFAVKQVKKDYSGYITHEFAELHEWG